MFENIGQKLKKLASIMGIGLGCLCILLGIIMGISDREFGAAWFFGSLIAAAVCCISSWPLYGFGQLIESTQNIENTICRSREYRENKESDYDEAHYWDCPKCGTINANYKGTCKCGEKKPFNNNLNMDLKLSYKNCPKCGTENTIESHYCESCGEKI